MSLSASLMVAALLLGVAATPATAERRSPGKRGHGGLRDIHVEPGVGNGSGTVMRIAVRPDGGLYVAIAGSSWQFVEEGKTYRMKFVFGNGRAYEEELKAADVGSEIVLVRPRMSAAFLPDFMEKTSLRVHCRDSLIEPVLLSDTYDAVTQLRTCNASIAGAPGFSDPSLR
jgi:hypothetical protein